MSNMTSNLLRTSMLCATLFSAYAPTAAYSAAYGTNYGTNYAACPTPACSYKSLVWSNGEFDQAYLVPAPSGAANRSPALINREEVANLLGNLRVDTANGSVSLLNKESAASLADGLAVAFANATAQQDVLFMITNGEEQGLFSNRLASSGRAFFDKNGLNIIFGELRSDFIGQYRATRKARAFDFGNRLQASGAMLGMTDGMQHPRKDWVILSLSAAATENKPLARTAASSAPAGSVNPGTAAAATATVTRNEQFYAEQELRLKSLKRLLEQNLITPDEYQQKKNDILKAW